MAFIFNGQDIVGNGIGTKVYMAQESLIYAGTEIIASENSTRWTSSTSFQEVSRTKSIGNGIPEKEGYTKKFKLCVKGVTKEDSNLVIAFGNVQMLNFQTWNWEATSTTVDYGTIMRSDLYSVSQLSDIYVEDGNQYYKNFYKLKMRSTTASKYVGITTAWLEWYYVKDV